MTDTKSCFIRRFFRLAAAKVRIIVENKEIFNKIIIKSLFSSTIILIEPIIIQIRIIPFRIIYVFSPFLLTGDLQNIAIN